MKYKRFNSDTITKIISELVDKEFGSKFSKK